MGAKGYWAPQANLITRGKKADLISYSWNSLNRNLLRHCVRNPAHLTALSFSRERFMTHLPILVGFPLGRSGTSAKVTEKFVFNFNILAGKAISKGFSSPNTGRRKLLTTSSKVIVSSPTKKKNVWRKGHQWCTKCLRPLVSLKHLRFLKIAIDFRISGRSKQLTNLPLESSLPTQMGQPVIFPRTKSKKMEPPYGILA